MPPKRRRSQRPRPPRHRPGAPFVTPPEHSPRRHVVEKRTAVWLVYLSKLPRWVPAVVFAALFLVGALYPGVIGAAALLLVAALLVLLAFVTWPAVSPPARVVRVLVVAALLTWGIAKLVLDLNAAH